MRSSDNTLKGVAANLICYFKNIESYNEKAIEKFITSDQILVDLKDKINDLETWDESSLDNLLLQYREEHELSVPKANQPIRIALTGTTHSPSLGMTLYLFDKQEVLKRLDQLINFLHTKN
jgi:glutamyl-tRNA synthetase